MTKELNSEAASQLSKLGAAKGGRARAFLLSQSERSDIARKAVQARWKKAKGESYSPVSHPETPPQKTPQKPISVATVDPVSYSMFKGKLTIGDVEMECHVLNDGKRVITQREMVRMISGGRESGDLKTYLEGNPLSANTLTAGEQTQFRIHGQPTLANGFEAPFLVDLCSKYSEAREQKLLRPNQLHLARRAEIILRACAKVGIIALIDEATGYQKIRERRALQLKVQAFIADEMQEWTRMFPEQFWLELARLEGVSYSPRSRPIRWGKYVMAFVYDAMDRDIGKKLREINKNPHYKQNHHQWLKEFGKDKLNNQLQRVIGTMQACDNIEEFKKKFAKILKKPGEQLDFDFGDAA